MVVSSERATRWSDHAYVLASSNSGENYTKLYVLTRQHGKEVGLVKRTKSSSTWIGIGNNIVVHKSSRSSYSVNFFSIEGIYGCPVLDPSKNLKLYAVLETAEMINRFLHLGEFNEPLYRSLDAFMCAIRSDKAIPNWSINYLKLEITLLSELGISPSSESLARCYNGHNKNEMTAAKIILAATKNDLISNITKKEFIYCAEILAQFIKKYLLTPNNVEESFYRKKLYETLHELQMMEA